MGESLVDPRRTERRDGVEMAGWAKWRGPRGEEKADREVRAFIFKNGVGRIGWGKGLQRDEVRSTVDSKVKL